MTRGQAIGKFSKASPTTSLINVASLVDGLIALGVLEVEQPLSPHEQAAIVLTGRRVHVEWESHSYIAPLNKIGAAEVVDILNANGFVIKIRGQE